MTRSLRTSIAIPVLLAILLLSLSVGLSSLLESSDLWYNSWRSRLSLVLLQILQKRRASPARARQNPDRRTLHGDPPL
jgi:hypothetical protein